MAGLPAPTQSDVVTVITLETQFPWQQHYAHCGHVRGKHSQGNAGASGR